MKRLISIYAFALWGQDLVSVVSIREGPYYRGFSFKVAPYIFNILETLSFNGVIEPFFIT